LFVYRILDGFEGRVFVVLWYDFDS